MSCSTASQKWSKTASSYVRYFEPSGLVLGRYMLNCMRLQFQEEPLTILEAGAGAGGLAQELLQLNGISLQQLVITDVSEGMLEKAKERLQSDLIKIEQADFTKFQYSDASFDRYYANLCLNYADNAAVVIREAYRVLRPGGICGFSFWGRSQGSELMTIVPDILDEFGLHKKDPNKRSSFYLGDEDELQLRKRFLDGGFDKCTVMHIPAAMECFSAEAYVELIIDGAASTKAQIEGFSVEDQKRVRVEVAARAKTILDSGRPMMMDMAVVVAQKKE